MRTYSSGYLNNLAYLQFIFGVLSIEEAEQYNTDYRINRRIDKRIASFTEKLKVFINSKLKNKVDDVKVTTNRAMKLLKELQVMCRDTSIQLEYLVLFIYLVRFYEINNIKEFQLVSEEWLHTTLDLLGKLPINSYEEVSFNIANKVSELL